MGLVAFIGAELGWLIMLALGAPLWSWLAHWLVVAVGEVIALPGLATRDRRAWGHFLTVVAAASVASYALGLVPLAFAAESSVVIRLLAGVGLAGWVLLAFLFTRFLWQVQGARRVVPTGNIEAVVVLGAGLIGDRPGPLLARRVERSVQVVQQLMQDRGPELPGIPLICSGGQGPDEPVTEASAMATYAREFARAEPIGDRLVVHEEDWAKNTRENIIFSTAVAEGIIGRPPARVAVVTSDFHVHRTELTAGRVMDECEILVLGAHTPTSSVPASLVREFIAQLADFVPRRR